MPKSSSFKIPDKILNELEENITKRVIKNIENIVEKKCKEIFAKKAVKKEEPTGLIKEEIDHLKSEWLIMQRQIGNLTDKTDHMLGSLTYIANEYDDFSASISLIKVENQNFMQDLGFLNDTVKEIKKQQSTTDEQLEALEQYGRRENIEIHGIPLVKNENTKEVVQKIAKAMNVQLDEKDISTAHRLSHHSVNFQPKNQHPPIIARFTNRDKRNEIFSKRLKIKTCSNVISTSGTAPVLPEKLAIRENLTKYRKFLFSEANKVRQALNYQFLWTYQGQILMRKNATSDVIKISNIYDLQNLQRGNRHSSPHY